jgi:hypothetical protein
MANYKTTETQVEKAGLFNHDKPKEGSIRDVHQKRKESRQGGKAMGLEMNKLDKYRDQSVIDKSFEARDAYEGSVQSRADKKGWSDRKRARVENKKGIELGDQGVMYTEKTSQHANEQKRLLSLPDNTNTTDIDKDRFKNTYSLSGKYKGTREKLTLGGPGIKPNPNTNKKDGNYSIGEEHHSNTSFALQKNKDKKNDVSMWRGGKITPNAQPNAEIANAAKNLHRRDVYTKKGREKLNSFYLNQSAISGEVDDQKTTTTTYSGKNKTDQRQNKWSMRTGRHPGGEN